MSHPRSQLQADGAEHLLNTIHRNRRCNGANNLTAIGSAAEVRWLRAGHPEVKLPQVPHELSCWVELILFISISISLRRQYRRSVHKHKAYGHLSPHPYNANLQASAFAHICRHTHTYTQTHITRKYMTVRFMHSRSVTAASGRTPARRAPAEPVAGAAKCRSVPPSTKRCPCVKKTWNVIADGHKSVNCNNRWIKHVTQNTLHFFIVPNLWEFEVGTLGNVLYYRPIL